MILFFGEGRLGNQIFQYGFIRNFARINEFIITNNFKEFKTVFNGYGNILNIQNKYITPLIKKLCLPILVFLSENKVISSVKVDYIKHRDLKMENNTYQYVKGFLPVTYIYPGFFQSEQFFSNQSLDHLRINQSFISKAKNLLKNNILKQKHKVFVHIRRGDYLNLSICGMKGANLPMSYYKKSISWFNHNYPDSFFIFFSDDIDFVKKNFQYVKNKYISEQSLEIDFALMTLCRSAILSNSTLSWWGAYFMKKRIKIISPKYWLGFKYDFEFPKSITPSFSETVQIR